MNMQHGRDNRGGFTLLEIMIVVAVIGMLAAIAIPSFMRARASSQRTACMNNLRQIESSKEQWSLENRKPQGAEVVTSEVDTFMRRLPVCPAGGTYDYAPVGSNSTCTIGMHELPR